MSAQYVPHVWRGTLLFVSTEHGVGWPSVSTLWRAFDASARSTGAGSCLAEVEIATGARSVFPSLESKLSFRFRHNDRTGDVSVRSSS